VKEEFIKVIDFGYFMYLKHLDYRLYGLRFLEKTQKILPRYIGGDEKTGTKQKLPIIEAAAEKRA